MENKEQQEETKVSKSTLKWIGAPRDYPEYCAIQNVDFGEFVTFMKDRSLYDVRLPVNNPEAYQYLRWANEYLCQDTNYLNYVLNIWDESFGDHVRPPTPREMAVVHAQKILDATKDEKDREFRIDTNAEFIRDAYTHWNYPDYIRSGLAGCIMKWGTFEDNEKPGAEKDYTTYEEWNK